MLVSIRKRWLGCWLAALCGGLGCARGGGEGLVIGTTWPGTQYRALESEFRRWAETGANVAGETGAPTITWIQLDPGVDLARSVERNPRLDLLLGAPASFFRRLASTGRLSPIERPGLPLWCVARRSRIGLAVNKAVLSSKGVELTSNEIGLSRPELQGQVALDDPRHDPLSLAWAKSQLSSNDWAAGYSELVRTAGNARSIGRRSGSALVQLERGAATFAPVVCIPDEIPAAIAVISGQQAHEWVEGAALLRDAKHPDAAQVFLSFLTERATDSSPPDADADSNSDDLLADLLGATLVDAHDELQQTWAELERSTSDRTKREQREASLTQAPPWPPASIEAIRNSAEPGPWVETLAEQLAPEPATRAWLMQSWQTSPRPIDGAFLSELSGAVGGRLAREPRFRAWLSAEWTEWARQRYRAASRVPEGAGATP